MWRPRLRSATFGSKHGCRNLKVRKMSHSEFADRTQLIGPSLVPALGVVCAFATMAYLATNISPMLMGSLHESGWVDVKQIGRIGTSELLAFGLASLLAPRLFSLRALRITAFSAAAVNCAGNFGSIALTGDGLMIGRIIAGLSEGIIAWVMFEFMARSRHPGRLMGIFSASFILSAALATIAGTALIVPAFGPSGLFVLLGTVGFLTGLLALLGLTHFDSLPSVEGDGSKHRLSGAAILTLANAFVYNAFTALIWVYWDPIATLCGLTREQAASAATVSLVAQFSATLISAWLSTYLPVYRTIVVVHAAALAAVIFVWSGPGVQGFYFFAIVFGCIIYFVGPFSVLLAAKADPSGRAIALLPGPILLGAASGPLLASLTISEQDLHNGVIAASILALLALALVLPVPLLLRRSQPDFVRSSSEA